MIRGGGDLRNGEFLLICLDDRHGEAGLRGGARLTVHSMGLTVRRLGCGFSFLERFAFLLLEVVADAMQVVGKNSEAGVAVVAGLAFVRATVQAVVLKGVNVALNGTVGVGLFTPLFIFLSLPIFGAEFAFFWHDHLGDAELQELPVFDAAKAAVEADADK